MIGVAGEMAVLEPKIESIKLNGSLTGNFADMARRLATLQMFSIKSTATDLTLVRVETTTVQKKPFLFMIFKFLPDHMEIDYSVPPDVVPNQLSSASLRRLFVLKNTIIILSLVIDQYRVDDSMLYPQVDSSIDNALTTLSPNYSSVVQQLETLYSKYVELRKLNKELANSNKNLSVQATMLSQENTELKNRLKQLETYSDESLMALVEEWIESHDGAIDINEFAGNYRITPPRVEQILNIMVSRGFIELKGQ